MDDTTDKLAEALRELIDALDGKDIERAHVAMGQSRVALAALEAEAKPAPAEPVPAALLAAARDALSVCDSVSTSRDRRVVRYGCVLYLQTEEWCTWAENEVAPKLRAALKAIAAAPAAPAPANLRERWNIERDGDDLLVCFNNHDKGEKCEYERFVRAPAATAQQAIHCKAKRDNGGSCPHHNLQCGWPDCNKGDGNA